MFKEKTQPRFLTEGAVKELVETALRSALNEQARDLERHLRDIDRRLKALESGR
jgi:hypothetical protein